MTNVEFFPDYACPWSYLALTRLTETALRTGARVVYRPVVVERIFARTAPERVGHREASLGAKARYRAKDLEDWARFCGIVLKRPRGWPANSGPAARAALAADQQARCAEFSKALFSAYFERGSDIEKDEVLTAAAVQAGLDTDRFRAALAEDGLSAALAANCDDLIARGGFGTPTLFVGDSMFFGNDRMPLVEFEIGQTSGRQFVAPGDHGA